MERESRRVLRDLKTVESRYGEDVLQLVIASGAQRDPGGFAPADPFAFARGGARRSPLRPGGRPWR